MHMRAVIKLVLLTALRDRLFTSIAVLVALIFGVSLFLGNAALVETSEAGIVYAGGATRFALVLGLAVFVAFQVQRLFEAREIEAILSRSISRTYFVIAFWAAFAAAAALLVFCVSVALFSLYGFSIQTATWCVSLLLECFVVLAFTIFAALTFERATTTIFIAAGFYAFARLIGFFLGIRDATPDLGANRVVNPMIDALGFVIPRLDLMTQTEWLVYGFNAMHSVPMVLAQSVIFIALALACAAFDLEKKQF